MVSDSQLISDLKDFANKLNTTPTSNEMDESGPWSAQTYRRHFDGWNNAIEKADLEKNVRRNIPKEELIDEIHRLATITGEIPLSRELENKGKFSLPTYIEKFGSWNAVLEIAGYELNKDHNLSREYIISQLKQLDENVNGRPRRIDVDENCELSYATFERHFGSWGKALEFLDYEWEFGEWQMGEDNPNWVEERKQNNQYYGPNWPEIRERVLKRDGFECQRCSESETLHVHHITPFKKFDDRNIANKLENLITLCPSCHRIVEMTYDVESTMDLRQHAD